MKFKGSFASWLYTKPEQQQMDALRTGSRIYFRSFSLMEVCSFFERFVSNCVLNSVIWSYLLNKFFIVRRDSLFREMRSFCDPFCFQRFLGRNSPFPDWTPISSHEYSSALLREHAEYKRHQTSDGWQLLTTTNAVWSREDTI